LSIGSIVQGVSKNITNQVISQKIDESLVITRNEILNRYDQYWKNLIISGGINGLIILTALLSFFLFSVNQFVILVISFLSIILVVRDLVLAIKTVIELIPYSGDIKVFIKDIFYFKSLSEAIKQMIRTQWNKIYQRNTNNFTRGVHDIFSSFDMVKSYNEIEEDIIDEYSHLIKNYFLRVIISKAVILTVFYGFFMLFLRTYIFSYTLHLNIAELLLYPFTVSLQKLIFMLQNGN
jgi:hypothetical protein